jgi:hypothetical protein
LDIDTIAGVATVLTALGGTAGWLGTRWIKLRKSRKYKVIYSELQDAWFNELRERLNDLQSSVDELHGASERFSAFSIDDKNAAVFNWVRVRQHVEERAIAVDEELDRLVASVGGAEQTKEALAEIAMIRVKVRRELHELAHATQLTPYEPLPTPAWTEIFKTITERTATSEKNERHDATILSRRHRR